jgi:hypothetical protein
VIRYSLSPALDCPRKTSVITMMLSFFTALLLLITLQISAPGIPPEPEGKDPNTLFRQDDPNASAGIPALPRVDSGPGKDYPAIEILNPLDESVFPSDMASPCFRWKEHRTDVAGWLIRVRFRNGEPALTIPSDRAEWTPDRATWETMKRNSLNRTAVIDILGYTSGSVPEVVSAGKVRMRTSGDPVGAPILFRRVPPSFSYASAHPEIMEWCLADVASYGEPPVIMSHQPSCASCHTFSRDGSALGMDVDYLGDKGSYFITRVVEDIRLEERDRISWNRYARSDGLESSGLFSRLSPDGSYVMSTVNDISFLAKISDPYCSQLFFPIQGNLAVYTLAENRMRAFPTGADRREIVDTDPSWSPEGKRILFARALMKRDLYAELGGDTVFSATDTDIEALNGKYPVQFDVYKVDFNRGEGGRAVPLEGASGNGRSNYFARYSPDGRWIVFTQSRAGLVLQPDSRLYIVPGSGGRARLMTCNRSRLNSWHSWSPNGRWLAFVSKENTPYTELYLTHLDAKGVDSVPVLVSRFNKPGYAINVPEFAPIRSNGIRNISTPAGQTEK